MIQWSSGCHRSPIMLNITIFILAMTIITILYMLCVIKINFEIFKNLIVRF